MPKFEAMADDILLRTFKSLLQELYDIFDIQDEDYRVKAYMFFSMYDALPVKTFKMVGSFFINFNEKILARDESFFLEDFMVSEISDHNLASKYFEMLKQKYRESDRYICDRCQKIMIKLLQISATYFKRYNLDYKQSMQDAKDLATTVGNKF